MTQSLARCACLAWGRENIAIEDAMGLKRVDE